MGCRQTADKASLIRVAILDGEFIMDADQRLPGRGAYLHAGCGAQAIRTRGVQRTLKVAPVPSSQLDALLAGLASHDAV